MIKGEIVKDEKEFDQIYKIAMEKYSKEIEKCKKDYKLQQRIIVPIDLDGMSIEIFLKALNFH